VRIGIAGPGRSGTTLLVQLFSEFGFRTSAENGAFYERAQAGFESRIDGTSEYEIDKDPWFFEYVNFIPIEALNQYELILIPIRNRQDVIVSRVSQERASRALEHQSSEWTWNTWGDVPGGAVFGIDSDSVNRTLSAGLWDLIEACERLALPYKFIHFPKFADDFDYFWSSLGVLIERKISKDEAKRIFEELVDSSKINSKSLDAESIKIRKLETIISILQKENFNRQRILLEAISERDSAVSEREKILHSKTWRLLGIYRKLKSYIPGQPRS
jgi:polyhydroxyalkanoate synthesis regulator phasin